ncbi:transposase (plasmid) [Pantoea sp. SGAir0184]|nr:putative transposase [Pantoea dispersa]MDR6296696.1 putative transposase [Pantoea dispersa]MDR6296731.1 putative transposase [Pantoea dispersa]
MPWTETVTMQRLEFILACQAGGESMTQLCHRHGISRKTGYKWLSRFNPGELSSLENLSRARHLQPDKIAPDIAARLVQFRQQHPDWGPKKIRHWFLSNGADFIVPAASTIGDLLKAAGMVQPRTPRKRTPGNLRSLTTPVRNNHVWSADFKGRFRLKDGSWCRPFTLTDNHSRYLLSCEPGTSETTVFVRGCMEKAFLEGGLPDVIRTDNGSPFVAPGILALTQLSVWLIKLGIQPERTAPGCPGQNARHERMHRSLKVAMSHHDVFGSLPEQQAWCSGWRNEFNQEKPHEAHGQQPPAKIWTPSPRKWNGKVPEVGYPEGAKLYKVGEKGDLRLNGRTFLSAALRGEYVRFLEVDDGIDVILFDRLILAYYDRAEKRIIRID